MQHRRFYINELTLEAQLLDGPGGALVVVKREDSSDIDWELVFQTKTDTPLEQLPFHLIMGCPQGELAGPAILVRTDGTSHVFRGAGELVGFTEDMFEDS